jgi:hypothetical protein
MHVLRCTWWLPTRVLTDAVKAGGSDSASDRLAEKQRQPCLFEPSVLLPGTRDLYLYI